MNVIHIDYFFPYHSALVHVIGKIMTVIMLFNNAFRSRKRKIGNTCNNGKHNNILPRACGNHHVDKLCHTKNIEIFPDK